MNCKLARCDDQLAAYRKHSAYMRPEESSKDPNYVIEIPLSLRLLPLEFTITALIPY